MTSSRRPAFAACALGIAIALPDSTAEPSNEKVDLEIQITWDASEPQLASGVGLVRNSSDSRIYGWSSLSLGGREHCSDPKYVNRTLSNGDPRLATQVAFDMPPGSWFASWQPYRDPAASCRLHGVVVLTSEMVGQEVGRFSRRASIPARPERPGLAPSGTVGPLELEAMVWTEEFILRGREPAGDALQLQLLARNKAQFARTIAITDRSIVCDNSSFAFVVGPGAGHPGMTSGPMTLSAGGWGVLAQRVRGSGDPSTCRYQLVISESRATSDLAIRVGDYSAKQWAEVAKLEGGLAPVGLLSYLSF